MSTFYRLLVLFNISLVLAFDGHFVRNLTFTFHRKTGALIRKEKEKINAIIVYTKHAQFT